MSNLILKTPELQVIEKSKAEQIKKTFEPMVAMLEEFEEAYNEIEISAQNEITAELTQKAKRIRLDIAKVRIETEKARKAQKEEYLRAGKAIDGVANILKWAVIEKENKLKEIEKYFEIQEQKRLEKLQADRAEKLSKYVEDAFERDLSKFEEDEFEALLRMKKQAYEDRIKAEKKAEEERIAREKAEAEERERIRKENERLKKEIEERERIARIEAEKRAKEESKRKAKEEAENKKREEEIRKEREAYELKLKKEREERKRIERIEREKREKLEAELKAKEEAKRKAEEKRLLEIERVANANDVEKVKNLISDLERIKIKYTFKSKLNKQMYNKVKILIDKIIIFIKK